MSESITITTFRDSVRRLSVTWLVGARAERFLYAIAIQLDALADMTVAGIKLRFPGFYSFDSLSQLSRDRRIRRGLTESPDTFADRLTRWLPDHQRRGGAYALLEQLHAFFAPNNFPIDLLYKSGRRYRMDAAGNITRDIYSGTLPTAQWPRWTLFYYTDAFPGPLTDAQKETLSVVPKEWIAAHITGRVLLMPTGAELYDYHQPPTTYDGRSILYNDHPPAVTLAII